MIRHRAFLSSGATLLLLTSTTQAQVASAILRVGDAPIGAAPGVMVTTLGGTSANEVGGVVVRVTLSSTNHAFWGAASSFSGVLIREEELVISGYEQSAFEGFFGASDLGNISYSPTCKNLTTLVTGLDCAWVDATPLAVEGDPIPTLPGMKYRFASRPGITASGIPYWVSGINDIATNTNQGDGIFYGAGATCLSKTGDPAPAPLTSFVSATDFDVRFSKFGTYNIQGLSTTDVATANTHIVVNGAIALDAGGNRVSEGTLVSIAAGGLGGEAWLNFGSLGVNEAGDWFAEGNTNGAAATNSFIVKNGVILYREGQVVGGLTLFGTVASAGAYMNDAGNIGYAWDTVGSITGIFVDNTLLLKEGDTVDFDGDGIVEATSIFKAQTVGLSLTVGNTHLSFGAIVTVAGVDRNCILVIALPNAATSFCSGDGSGTVCPCANGGLAGRGCASSSFANGARLTASGKAGASAVTDTLTLTASDVSGPGLFFQGTSQFAGGSGLTFGDGLLCAGGTITRMGVVFPASGSATYPGGLTPNPIHISGATSSGDVRHYQCWYRDSSVFCAAETYNLTQGVTVTWGP
ncbi:MAG: hypothetical protein SGI72_14570 [Planctomycetota bacterium]|nr:hypothetical protein [Planctomycetota bacterium]